MLESPTGTGKTLCLLTSSLAWREHKLKQAEAAQLALAEQNELFLDGDFTRETLAKNNIAPPRVPVIIYASRTHSQLSQVVAELHRTAYAASLKICVLGSRSQMCIHPVVSQVKGGMSAMNRTCTAYVKRQACSYHSNYERYPRESVPKTRDIEDLVAWGRKHEVCPFYTSKAQQDTADIIFVPYNYIIDPLIRKSLSVDLQGSVVILDEAHNLESVASDAASFELSSADLRLCLTQIQQYIDMKQFEGAPPLLESHLTSNSHNKNDAPRPEFNDDERAQQEENVEKTPDEGDFMQVAANPGLLKTMITNLLSELVAVVFPAGSNAKVGDGKWIYEIFARIGITNDNAEAYLALVDRMAFELSESQGSYVQTNTTNAVNPFAGANAMSSLSECLRKMFMSGLPVTEVSSHFKAVLQRDQPKTGFFSSRRTSDASTYASLATTADGKDADPNAIKPAHPGSPARSVNPFERQWTYKLSLWCFYPGMAMKSLMNTGVRSLIVTSGTLSPLDSFAYELGIPFPLRLENAHVIPTSQIWVGVLPVSVDGESLNSAFLNRSQGYMRSLGLTLVNLARISPAGMLVFFPSYDMMEQCIQVWRTAVPSASTIWEQITGYKQAVIEPKESKMLKFAMKDYYDKVDAPMQGNMNGAIFLAVCRGKVSEGLDFSNQYGRTVVVTGLPLAQNKDQKVKLKKEYLDNQAMLRKAVIKSTSGSSEDAYQLTDKPLTGGEWYAQSAWRAVNQAIGRVIRHRNDYGAIVFADERFVSAANVQLSKWLRPHVATIRNPGAAFQGMAKFFAANAQKFPPIPPLLSAPSTSSMPHHSSGSSNAPHTGAGSSGSTHQQSSRPMSAASHIATSNAKRGYVFDALESAKRADAATAAASAAAKAEAAKTERNPALVLTFAKDTLDPETFNKFQTALKQYNKKKIPREELPKMLEHILKDYPKVLGALREYLTKNNSPAATPATSASKPPTVVSTSKPPTAHDPAPLQRTLPKPTILPTPSVSSPKPSLKSQKPSNSNPVASAQSSAKNAPAISPITIQDSESLEILEPPVNTNKKRMMPDPPKAPPPKRFAHAHRAAVEVPGDSLLDTSVCSNDFETEGSSATKTATSISLEILPSGLGSSSSSLRIIQAPATTASSSLEVINDPLALGDDMNIETDSPLAIRRSSSDVSPSPVRDPSRLQSLSRGNSGGLPNSPKPNGASKAYTTPKKPTVDLLTGKIVSSSTKSPMWIRRSPPKVEDDSVEIVPIHLPSTSSATDAGTSQKLPEDELSLEPSSQSAECPICARTQTNFRTAPCGHSCCLDCWNNWLATKLECPFCRGRVRVKKLEKKPHTKDA